MCHRIELKCESNLIRFPFGGGEHNKPPLCPVVCPVTCDLWPVSCVVLFCLVLSCPSSYRRARIATYGTIRTFQILTSDATAADPSCRTRRSRCQSQQSRSQVQAQVHAQPQGQELGTSAGTGARTGAGTGARTRHRHRISRKNRRVLGWEPGASSESVAGLKTKHFSFPTVIRDGSVRENLKPFCSSDLLVKKKLQRTAHQRRTVKHSTSQHSTAQQPHSLWFCSCLCSCSCSCSCSCCSYSCGAYPVVAPTHAIAVPAPGAAPAPAHGRVNGWWWCHGFRGLGMLCVVSFLQLGGLMAVLLATDEFGSLQYLKWVCAISRRTFRYMNVVVLATGGIRESPILALVACNF